MKDNIRILTVMLLLGALLLPVFLGIPVSASDITNAEFYGIIRIVNNSTAVTNITSNITNIEVTDIVNGGYIPSASNSTLAMRTSSGADVAFQPGYLTNTWMTFVSSLAASGQDSYVLYCNNVTGGKTRYFPSTAGMTRNDVAGLELGSNFTIEQAGFYDTSAGATKYYTYKPGAIIVYEQAAGNIRAAILATTHNTPTSSTDTSGNWSNDAQAYDDNTGTSAVCNNVPAGAWSDFLALNIGAANMYALRVYPNMAGTMTEIDVDVFYAAAWHDVYSGVYTNAAWNYYYLGGTYSVTAIRYRAYNSDVGAGQAAIAEADFESEAEALAINAATTSAEHLVKTFTDGTDFKIYVDNVEIDTVALGAVTVADTPYGWYFLLNNSMPYMEYHRMTIGGNLKQYVYWEYAANLTDHSGWGLDMTTTNFAVNSSDADVTASLTTFLPITEATAPAYALGVAPDFIATAPNLTSDFSDSVTPSVPGSEVIIAIATDSGTPEQLLFTIITCIVVLTASILATYIMRKYGTANSIFVKMVIILAIMGISVSVGVFDFWMILFFLIPALALAWASRSQGQSGVIQ